MADLAYLERAARRFLAGFEHLALESPAEAVELGLCDLTGWCEVLRLAREASLWKPGKVATP